MLFYIEYGCSCELESLVIDAPNEGAAVDFAIAQAVDSYWSFDNQPDRDDYSSEEEWLEVCEDDCQNDIRYLIEVFDENNLKHIETKSTCGVYEV